MKNAIFYFSGTGNSLFVAKKIQEEIGDSELIPIVKTLQIKNKVINAEKVIIVFPIYALTIPLPVRRFFKEFDFHSEYISTISTRLGTYFNDFDRIEKYIRSQKISSQFIINMGNNDIKVKNYKCPSKAEIAKFEKDAMKEIEKAVEIIRSRKIYKVQDRNFIEPMPFGDYRDKFIWWLIPKLMTFSKLIGGVNYFYINNKCNGCGSCLKVCLSNKISMKDKQPIWNKRILCHMCYACVNFCPLNAIEIASIPGVQSHSHKNDRYSHPYATIKDIQNQKR
ncbi:MAG: hypothetical protein GY756_05185 [bacterium]|nr:hypothetical protein [bacterium]